MGPATDVETAGATRRSRHWASRRLLAVCLASVGVTVVAGNF